MVLPLFSSPAPEEPSELMAFSGLLASAALVMMLLSMVLPSFPVVPVVVLKFTMPPVGSIVDPLMVQYFTVLVVASLINRMVEVPVVDAVLGLMIARLFVLPVAFTLPSMVTLSAPFRSISGVAIFPEMMSPVETGYMLAAV